MLTEQTCLPGSTQGRKAVPLQDATTDPAGVPNELIAGESDTQTNGSESRPSR